MTGVDCRIKLRLHHDSVCVWRGVKNGFFLGKHVIHINEMGWVITPEIFMGGFSINVALPDPKVTPSINTGLCS